MSQKFRTISYSWVPKTHPNPNPPPFKAKNKKKKPKQKKKTLRNVSEQTNNKELKQKLHIQTFHMKMPFPKISMGAVYSPTFTINIDFKCR